jgi:uncharacterized protein (TIGR03000 family)
MKFHRSVWALLAAAVLLGSIGISEVNAFGRRGYVAPQPGLYYPMAPMYGYYYNPYVLPLPAYGILPVPLNQNYYREDSGYGIQRAADDYGYQLDTPARKRSSMYPAVPFEKSPEERLLDLRRVRFEITVPYADAVVFFDGVKTKQTGTTRVFMTPPMQEDRDYSVTIMVQWTKDDGTPSLPRSKTFNVVAGETIRHTFIE